MNGDPRSTQTTLGALALVLVLLGGFAALPRLFGHREAAGVGRDAPEFSLAVVANGGAVAGDTPPPGADATRKTLRLSELRGRPVVLDFWATWCPPCRAEAPIVDQVSRRWRDRGVVVLGVATDTPDQGDPGAYAASHGLSYPIVHDVTSVTSRAYDVESLPTLVVISREGRITAVRTGITDDAEIEKLIRQVL
ncbi:MAG TPA: TlpA disulfide reductase family protein [Polyangiaceae bacterium]|jgi:thiol-disulfide isomerase/thioredoxin